MDGRLVLAAKALALTVLAVIVGLAVMVVVAVAENRLLMATIGTEGIVALDDSLPWRLMLAAIYLAGILAGVATFVLGWRRFVRRSA